MRLFGLKRASMLRGVTGILVAVCCLPVLRAVAATPPVYAFAPSGKDGGGCQTSVAPDPFNPGRVIAGGDGWPFHRSTNYGRDWTPIAVRDAGDTHGLFMALNDMSAAAVRFSLKTTNLVYAGVGLVVGGGGFLKSTNAGSTWVKASTVPQFVGNNDSAPLVSQGHPRSVGNLIALDPSGSDEYIYVGTYSNGVMRSHDAGQSWTTIALPGLATPYVRGLALDDLVPTTLYVACYDTDGDGVNEAVYQVTDARNTNSAALIASTPFLKAEELVVVHGILYVAANTDGVYKYDPAQPPAQAWTRLYSDTSPSQFYSIDGFWDSGSTQAVLFAGTTDNKPKPVGNGLCYSLLRSKDSGGSWVCLTADTTQIHTNMVMGGPGGGLWWLSTPSGNGVTDCIGGSDYTACQTLLDPTDPTHRTLYVAGRSGMWRSDDALTVDNPTWYACMRHLNAAGSVAVVADPNSPGRAACLDVDWTFQYSTDDFSHITQKATSLGGQQEWCLELDSTTDSGVGKVSALYMGRDKDLLYCANPDTANWVSTGLGNQGNVYGCSIKYLPGIGTVVLAAVQNSGIWRKIGAGGAGSWGSGPIYAANNVMQGLSANNQRSVFSWGAGASQMVYFTDRQNGVFRSLDAGLTWTVVITPGSPGGGGQGTYLKRSGSVAVDPTDGRNCYVTQTTGLYYSTNADTSATFTAVTLPGVASSVPPGWAAYDDAGNVYVNTLITATSQPKLFFKAKGDTTWYELSNGDPVFQSLCGTTLQMTVGPGPAHVIFLSGTGMAVVTQTAQSVATLLHIVRSGAQFVLSGTGPMGATYEVLSSTNLGRVLTTWDVLATQATDGTGAYSWTNGLDTTSLGRFFRLLVR
jgi:hypothetical protein